MYVLLILGLLVMGCQTPEQREMLLQQQRAEHLWRLEHPYEAQQLDLLKQQAAREEAESIMQAGDMWRRSYQNSIRQPQPMPRRQQNCTTMAMGGGMYNTNCW